MISKGIRGAITVENNTVEDIRNATLELVETILKENSIKKDDISHVIFTLTDDLNAAFPAKFVRLELDWSEVAMICCHELDVPNSLRKCLRVLIVVNVGEGFEPKFVYLKGAEKLRQS